MFDPKYVRDNFSINYDLEEIKRIIFRVDKIVILPKYEQWLQRETFLRTAYSSTMVENAQITEQERDELANLAPIATIPEKRPDVINYAKALEFIDFIGDTDDIAIDETVIRQIHWHLMKEIKDTYLKPGLYRTEPNWIELDGVKVYDPPFYVNAPGLMTEFSEWLKTDHKDYFHPIIKAGIAHAQLVAIHPFVDGNGRTARLLALLMLRRYGYGFRKMLSLDDYYQLNRNEYISILQKTFGNKYTEGFDFTPWLSFFTRALLLQVGFFENKLTDWRMFLDQSHAKYKPLGLSDRQIDGMIYAMRTKQISRKDYMEITTVSPLTATRDLADMVSKNILVPVGNGRNRVYKVQQTIS